MRRFRYYDCLLCPPLKRAMGPLRFIELSPRGDFIVETIPKNISIQRSNGKMPSIPKQVQLQTFKIERFLFFRILSGSVLHFQFFFRNLFVRMVAIWSSVAPPSGA